MSTHEVRVGILAWHREMFPEGREDDARLFVETVLEQYPNDMSAALQFAQRALAKYYGSVQ